MGYRRVPEPPAKTMPFIVLYCLIYIQNKFQISSTSTLPRINIHAIFPQHLRLRASTSNFRIALIYPTPLFFPIQHLWTPVSNIIGYLYPDPLDTPTQCLWIPLSKDFGDFRGYDKMTSKPSQNWIFRAGVRSRFKFSILARFGIRGLLANSGF